MARRWLRKMGLAGTFIGPAVVMMVVFVQLAGVSGATEPLGTSEPPGDTAADAEDIEAPPTAQWQHRNFFELSAEGVAGRQYDELTAEERASFDAAKAHYDTNAEQIARAYSRGTRARVERAKLEIAAREAGLSVQGGIADVGVE